MRVHIGHILNGKLLHKYPLSVGSTAAPHLLTDDAQCA
jgi:hypothetical protein